MSSSWCTWTASGAEGSQPRWPVTEKIQTERTQIKRRILIMKNQPVFVRIQIPEIDDCLLSEISLYSVLIANEVKKVGYYVFEDSICYIGDDLEIMLAHLNLCRERWNDFSPSTMISVAPNWRKSSPFTATLVRGELERGDAMETMESLRHTKTWRNVRASVTRRCIMILKLKTFKFGSLIASG